LAERETGIQHYDRPELDNLPRFCVCVDAGASDLGRMTFSRVISVFALAVASTNGLAMQDLHRQRFSDPAVVVPRDQFHVDDRISHHVAPAECATDQRSNWKNFDPEHGSLDRACRRTIQIGGGAA
jgi:hypothetical protein